MKDYRCVRRCCWGIALICCFIGSVAARADIQLPKDAPECVRWGASNLSAALAAKGVPPKQAKVSVTIAAAAEPDDQEFWLKNDGDGITIRAGGPVGAMYGLLELTEQVQNSSAAKSWRGVVAVIESTHQRPYVAIRADNAFIHAKPLLINDVAMWRDYLDMLARNRYNMLDLHATFVLETTGFGNIYPLLVHLQDYPDVGDEKEQSKNLADFKAIVAYAKARGIEVALMNYSVTVPVPGKERERVFLVPPEKLADYTAKAVAALLRAVPDLHEIGFRVGETGQPASFHKDSYLKGIAEADRPDLRLYTRSWLTTQDQLEPIAQAAKDRFDVEIKYNGEHLGLPYHAMQERFGTYSYEHYLNVPADFRILWQVRANGTHRFWAWENTDFIRRTVRTCTLGNARGFTLEPPIAYFSVYPTAYYRSESDQRVYRYIWQKHWMWYFAWGRLGYNPDLPERTIVSAYASHYGPAGAIIYQAMQAASRIVPLVYAYRFNGADHRDYSPETDTGYIVNRETVVNRRRPVPEGLLQYALNAPEDERSFMSIDAYVNNQLEFMRRPDGRVGPFAVAQILKGASEDTRKSVAQVSEITGNGAGEWRLLKTDLLAAAALGEYHSKRIQGLTWVEHAVKTNAEGEYQKGVEYLTQSRESWKQLAEITDSVYGPVQNPLRGQRNFEWKSQLPKLEKIDASAADLWEQRPRGAHSSTIQLLAADRLEGAGLSVAQVQYTIVPSKRSATFTCLTSAKGELAHVVLWWKPLPSDTRWAPQEMFLADDGSYSTTLPLTHEGLMYMVEVQDKAGNAQNFPPVLQETPYWVLPPFPYDNQLSSK